MSSQLLLELQPGDLWSEIVIPAGSNHAHVQGQSATTAIIRRAAAKPQDDDGNGMWLHSDDICELPLELGDKLFWRPHPSIPAKRAEPARILVTLSARSTAVNGTGPGTAAGAVRVTLASDGAGVAALGAPADAAVTNPGAAASIIAALKGLLATTASWLALATATAATDANRLPVMLPDGASGNGSVTSAAVLFTVDTTGYSSLTVQFTSMGTTNTFLFEGSSDGGVTWPLVVAQRIDTPTTGTSITSTAGTASFSIPATHKLIRVRCSVYTSGTAAANYLLRADQAPTMGIAVTNATLPVIPTAATTGGGTNYKLIAAAGTNATLIKGTVGNIHHIYALNVATTGRFLKIFSKATAPVPGTDVPVRTVYLPPGAAGAPSVTQVNFTPVPLAIATGIGFCLTTGIADNDTGALTAGDVQLYLSYT